MLGEYAVAVLNNELDRDIFGTHVCHLSFDVRVPHNSRSEDDS